MPDRGDAPPGLIALVAVLQIVLGVFLARAYVDSHNTLYKNGRWIPTKTTLAGGIIGAQSFLFQKQALARDQLNLNQWFGYQEVVSAQEFDPESISFKFAVSKGGYLAFGFNRAGGRYSGLVFSATERFPPGLVTVTEKGEFVQHRELPRLGFSRPGRAHRLRVEFDTETESHFKVFLNGKKLKRFKRPIARPMRISFRGNKKMVFVDNVGVLGRDGSVFFDDFSRPAGWRLAYIVSIGGFVLGSLLLFLILRRLVSISDKYLLFYFLMFSFVLLPCIALYTTLVWRQVNFYPNRSAALENQERAYADAGTDRMIERIESEYQPVPEPGVERILFIGSSQTRGSGATEPEHTLVRQTQRLLNRRAGEKRFECLNVAVRAYHMEQMLADFEERWVDWGATMAIVNAGYNDRTTPTAQWARDLRRLIEVARDADIQLVFIPEASEPPGLTKNMHRIHRSMRSIARAEQIPVIEMYDHLQGEIDSGFLWWDWVHMTSFGQRLFAEHLAGELERLQLVDFGADSWRERPPPGVVEGVGTTPPGGQLLHGLPLGSSYRGSIRQGTGAERASGLSGVQP